MGTEINEARLKFIHNLSRAMDQLKVADCAKFAELLDASDRIFVCGAGRSGLVGKFFAMRLMHLGKLVFIVGETTTPAIRSGDLLVTISGSGKTQTVLDIARVARDVGASLVTIGIQMAVDTPLDQLSDLSIKMNRRLSGPRDQTEVRLPSEQRQNAMPLGTLFELSALIYLEVFVSELIVKSEITEGEMKQRHANLE
jgi:6-phospho-3-hexuloisomerase